MNKHNIEKAKRLHKKRVQKELKTISKFHKVERMTQFYRLNKICNPRLMYSLETTPKTL
jgi:ribosomal protein RSM22 (predicted rRNA methylase)